VAHSKLCENQYHDFVDLDNNTVQKQAKVADIMAGSNLLIHSWDSASSGQLILFEIVAYDVVNSAQWVRRAPRKVRSGLRNFERFTSGAMNNDKDPLDPQAKE
jgi:hypothetical protein